MIGAKTKPVLCFNTQPPEGGWRPNQRNGGGVFFVSTHSHPKVAGSRTQYILLRTMFQHTATRRWLGAELIAAIGYGLFQHTATRRWLAEAAKTAEREIAFQHTATRRWLGSNPGNIGHAWVFQHTATRRWLVLHRAQRLGGTQVSTHSHPKVAGGRQDVPHPDTGVSTHSHPKVAGPFFTKYARPREPFQHTATRRWLVAEHQA